MESLQSSPLKTRSKRAVTVDASFYLEAASGHFLFGEDDSSAATTNRRSPYGGMADFGDARTGRLATICDRDLIGELSVFALKKIRFIRCIFKVSSGIITVSSVFTDVHFKVEDEHTRLT